MSTQTTPKGGEDDMERRFLRVFLYFALAFAAFLWVLSSRPGQVGDSLINPVVDSINKGTSFVAFVVALAGLAASAKRSPLR